MTQSTRLVTYKTDSEKAYLLPWGDVHWGHPSCDQEKAVGYLDWSAETGSPILLMGDLIENSTRGSVGAGVYEQILNPDTQIEEMLDLLSPHSARILGVLTGNHEERTFKDSGVDPSRHVARVLGVPYLRYASFIRLHISGVGYTVYATHGAAGGATSAGKLNAVKRMATVADADVYLMGHMHELLLDTVVRKYVDLRNRTVKDRRQHFVVTGNFLTYEDSYGEMKGYAPSKIGAPRIRFSGVEHDVHVSF